MPRLLIRPPLKQGEWWDSYVARVLTENGHAPNRDYFLKKLEPLVAQISPEEARLAALAGGRGGESLSQFGQCLLPAWAVRGAASATAHCPECFSQEAYVRQSWRLRAVTHCSLHDRPLQTQCASCRRPLFHWDLARAVCLCGASLYGLPASPERPGDTAPDIAGRTDQTDWLFAADEAESIIAQASDLGHASSAESLAALVFLGGLLPRLAKVKVVGQEAARRTVDGFLNLHTVTLMPAVRCVEEVLGSLRSAVHLCAALTFVLSVAHAEKSGNSALGRLPLNKWADQLCGQGASPQRAERLGLIAPGTLGPGLLPLRAAAREAGLDHMYVKFLMKRGVVSPTRTLELGERQVLFSEPQIQLLAKLRPAAYGYGHSLDLGLEGDGAKVMRIARVVDAEKDSSGRLWLDGGEVRALLAALQERAVEVEAIGSGFVNLGSKCIWQQRYVPVLKTLIDRLLSGAIELQATGDRSGFARFFVHPAALLLLRTGILAGRLSESETAQQRILDLAGGCFAWVPTPTAWDRPPRLRIARGPSLGSTQIQMDFGGGAA